MLPTEFVDGQTLSSCFIPCQPCLCNKCFESAATWTYQVRCLKLSSDAIFRKAGREALAISTIKNLAGDHKTFSKTPRVESAAPNSAKKLW